MNLYEIDFMIVMNIFVRIMCSTFFTAHQGSRKLRSNGVGWNIAPTFISVIFK